MIYQKIRNCLKPNKSCSIRNLYAHNVGIIDDEYIEDWKRLTGEDLLAVMTASGYPASDAYWFRPLLELSAYIENLREFVRALP